MSDLEDLVALCVSVEATLRAVIMRPAKPNTCRVHPCMTIIPAGRVVCWFHRRER